MRAPNNFEIYRWEDVEEAKNETVEEFEELPSRYSNPKIEYLHKQIKQESNLTY